MSEPGYHWNVSKGSCGGTGPDAPPTTTSVTITQGGYTIFHSDELPDAEGERLYDMLYKLACIHNREIVVVATLPRP
jgi:hypothetical protein